MERAEIEAHLRELHLIRGVQVAQIEQARKALDRVLEAIEALPPGTRNERAQAQLVTSLAGLVNTTQHDVVKVWDELEKVWRAMLGLHDRLTALEES